MAISSYIPLNEIPLRAKELAKTLKGGETLALIGNLGSGKTTFTKFLAKSLKVTSVVSSPTFVIMNHYTGKLVNNKKITLCHVDLYRTKSFSEVKNLGLAEIWNQPHTITIIEWANKINNRLPKNTIFLHFRTL